jgi:A/G-specific adenine glycosylase
MKVFKTLGEWYDRNKRNLPWRETNDPYKIWVSEVILQQTRVGQGINYYHNFLKNFPTVDHLASASIDDVLKIWQGLGYYTRARNMHEAAKSIVAEYGSKFPEDLYSLKRLKGIGDYSAAAIASIAFNKPHPLVDGNVFRVLARFLGIEISIDSAEGKKQFYQIAGKLLDKKNPGRHNQAIMELGAVICLPKNPQCILCPIAKNCFSRLHNSISKYPVKKLKIRQRVRYFYYIMIRKQNHTFIIQRKKGDIWALLYEFPLIETKEEVKLSDLFELPAWAKITKGADLKTMKMSKVFKHQLTHQIINAMFIEITVQKDFSLEQFIEIEYNKLSEYPVSRLMDKYLNDKIT